MAYDAYDQYKAFDTGRLARDERIFQLFEELCIGIVSMRELSQRESEVLAIVCI